MCNLLSHVAPKVVFLVSLVLILADGGGGLVLRAVVSQWGLHGEVEFSRKSASTVAVRTSLTPTLQHPEHALRWAVHAFPVDHRDVSGARCAAAALGPELFDLTEELGFLLVPGKERAEFETARPLTGPGGFWGRSLRLESAEGHVACASILAADDAAETYAEAQFTSPVVGTVGFRWLATAEADEADADVTADLYHMRAVRGDGDYTEHKWKLFVTDIFDSDRGNHEDNCNVLQAVFDPVSAGDGLSVGDLDARLGPVRVAREPGRPQRAALRHAVLAALRHDMRATRRSLYLVLYDHQHSDSFLACAKLRLMPPQTAKVLVSMSGVRGSVSLTQRAATAPTWATFQLAAADAEDYEANLRFAGSVLRYSIRELPPAPADPHPCNHTGGLYNPSGIDLTTVPPPGMGTQDQYAVGDLLGKLLGRSPRLPHAYLLPGLAPELAGAYWDAYLPLRGPHSVRHRALLIERRAPKEDVCGTVVPYEYGTDYQTPMSAAQVVFRYPLVGRIVFRQPKDRPWEDTTITIENLIHADGANVNDTFGHRWALHEHAPGADFYNWSRRCESAGAEWEPRALQPDARQPDAYCAIPPLCRLGDLATRHGTLTVAGRKRDAARLTRRQVTDPVLALAGRYSILRHSLLILDDHGPVARGDRMACSIVGAMARRKAVAHDWFGEGAATGAPQGRLELTQQTEYDVVNVQLKLDQLDDVNDYRIHVAPVEKDLEFPCETTSLLETYNPYNVNKSLSPPPTKGTVDEYPVGALGDKFGLLAGLRRGAVAQNDTQLTLFGSRGVLGRSLLLWRGGAARARRWACATVERGYSPSEARELRAVASFHHPGGFAWGYVRFTQLVSNDGSASDTVIEVNLRYPGERDRNVTYGHRWEVFVNPVGVDAAVAVAATRCVAGGYRWNPYFTQLADPLNRELYDAECGPDNPLRCDVGDLTSRLGTINVGAGRQVVTDSNLPLEGTARALGRSLVVFAPGGGSDRLACANIEEDHDIVKFVNIMKPPRFAIGQFLADVRRVLGAPRWLVWAETRRTRTLHHAACLQLLLHFSGPLAGRLELDFTKLLASGRLDSPSLAIPGFVDSKRKRTISYRACGVTDPSDRSERKKDQGSLFAPHPSRAPPRLATAAVLLLIAALV